MSVFRKVRKFISNHEAGFTLLGYVRLWGYFYGGSDVCKRE